MEPICYLMTFGNFTFSYFFYLALHQETEFQSVRELLTEREVKRVFTKERLEQHEQDKKEIEQLRSNLKVIFWVTQWLGLAWYLMIDVFNCFNKQIFQKNYI